MISFQPSAKFNKKFTLIFLTKEQVSKGKYSFSNASVAGEIKNIAKSGSFEGASGELFPIATTKTNVILCGVGKQKDITATSFRINVRGALLSSYLKAAKDIEVIGYDQSDECVLGIIEGYRIGTYAWKKYISKPKDDKTVESKNLTIIASKKKIYDDAVKICDGVDLTRDLVNDNADVVHSGHFEKVIKGLIKNKKKVSVEILNRRELKAKGLNLHLAVNQGSKYEPKLIIVKYNGAGAKEGYTALIGKGMTYDTGGLNLKPSGHIETMRMDMGGAASVAGVLKNAVSLGLKKNILFVFGMAENAIGPDAYKPGDVFKSYSGKTVEIGNTDAEGRLVLADAIAYIVKNYKPKRIVDIATLTGACIVALGYDYTGLVSTDDKFARQLIHSSNDTDDRAWRLPTYPELKDSVKSNIADIRNLGSPKGAAGALTAAEFLRQFTNGTSWAHLDIAGTAFVEGKGRMYYGYGATGASVRMLTDFLKRN